MSHREAAKSKRSGDPDPSGDAKDKEWAVAIARSKFGARPAEWLDTIGKRSNRLFAVNANGHRIGCGRFYRLAGEGHFRKGFVLVTTAKPYEPSAPTLFGR